MNSQPTTTTTLGKSKRIASNALVLFFRMVAVMVINLYTVRVVLHSLGQTDFGLFNAIAGVVLTSTFISSTLSISVQRFYSYALGKNEPTRLKEYFSASVNITFAISLLIILFFEAIGLWFIHHQLTIPPERMYAAEWIFQFSVFSFVLNLMQIPYTAAVFANEDMGIYALISFLDCLGKLLIAYLIGRFLFDNLIFYGLGLLIVALCVYVSYFIIGKYRYPECHYQLVKTNSLYKELLSFSGWTMYGTVAGVGMIQGTTIILNIFFGPITNAAYAIANQIYNAANALCNSIILAFRPAMIKAYAQQSHDYLLRLFSFSNKFIFFLLISVAIPCIIEVRTVLHWWLDSVSEETIIFSRLFMLYLVCMTLHNPITTIIQATGQIRTYYLLVESITLMCLPLTWLLLSHGHSSHYAFYSMIGICIVSHIVRLLILKRQFSLFSIYAYFFSFIGPSIIIVCGGTLMTLWIHNSIDPPLIRFWTVTTLSPLITIFLSYTIGLAKSERKLLHSFISQILKNKIW